MKRLQALLLGYCLLVLPLGWYFTQYSIPHGLTFQNGDLHRQVFATRNAPFAAESLAWEGHLWLPTDRTIDFAAPSQGTAILQIDGKTANLPAALSLDAGYHTLQFQLIALPTDETYFVEGLHWETLFGTRLIPSPYLLPTDASPDNEVRTDYHRAQIWNVILVVGLVLVSISCSFFIWHTFAAFSTRAQLVLLGVLILQITIGAIYYRDFLPNAPENLVYRTGSDHLGYVINASNFARGLWPDSAFYVQPGFTLSMGVLNTLISPDIQVLHLAQFAAGLFFTLMLVRIGLQLMPSNQWFAIGVALIWSLIPMLPLYYAFALTHAAEAFVSIAIIYLWTRALQSSRLTINDAMFGLVLGVAIVIRPTFLLVLPLAILSLFWVKLQNWQALIPAATRSIVIAALAALAVAPITLFNYRASGETSLVSANGPVNLYLGNNTSASGVLVYSPNFYYAQNLVNRGEATYSDLTLAEIQEDPVRWIQLLIRKAAFIFGNTETSSNVNFYKHAYNISWLMRLLPFRFGILSILGFIGLTGIAFRKEDWRNWIPTLGVASIVVASGLLFFAATRFRVSLYASATLLACYGIWHLSSLRGAAKQARVTTTVIGCLVAAFVMSAPAIRETVVKAQVDQPLPETAQWYDQPVNDFVNLEALEVTEALAGEGQLIDLYWRVTGPIPNPENLNVSLKYTDQNQQVVFQLDRIPATGNHPAYPPTEWQIGELVKDTHFVRLPNELYQTDLIRLDAVLYNKETFERYGQTAVDFFSKPVFSEHVPLEDTQIPIGQVVLDGITYAQSDHVLDLDIYLTATQSVTTDGALFFHIFDAQDNFIVGDDRLLHDGFYPATRWDIGEQQKMTRQLDLSSLPAGTYSIRMGIYSPDTVVRWPIAAHYAPTGHADVIEITTLTIDAD